MNQVLITNFIDKYENSLSVNALRDFIKHQIKFLEKIEYPYYQTRVCRYREDHILEEFTVQISFTLRHHRSHNTDILINTETNRILRKTSS